MSLKYKTCIVYHQITHTLTIKPNATTQTALASCVLCLLPGSQ